METTSSSNVGRSNLPRESASQRAAWDTDQTPVVTRSDDISRVQATSSMVFRSHTRGGRSSATIPYVYVQPEIGNSVEIQVSMSATCEGGSGTTRLDIPKPL